MRQDAGLRAERLEPEPGEEAALGPLDVGAGHAVGLLVDVDRRVRVLAERPVGAPGGERPRGAPVAVVGLVAGLLGRQVEADDVGRSWRASRRALGRPPMTSYGGATTGAEVADGGGS